MRFLGNSEAKTDAKEESFSRLYSGSSYKRQPKNA